MFPTTRVVELSWLARCVVRPARPTAFNRCVCSPFLASVSLCTYRVFGNCRIQPERNNRVPRHEARLDLPFDLPSSPLRAILFVSVSFFFPFLLKPTALTNCFRSQLTQIDRDGESKRLWKDCYKNDWTSNISKSASVVGDYTRFLNREGPLLNLLVILCLLTVYICVFAHSEQGDRRIHILTRIMTTFTSDINERASRRTLRYWAAIAPLKITYV